nr:hypothetical protein HUO10_000956 [Paraburkholderia busanensis]
MEKHVCAVVCNFSSDRWHDRSTSNYANCLSREGISDTNTMRKKHQRKFTINKIDSLKSTIKNSQTQFLQIDSAILIKISVKNHFSTIQTHLEDIVVLT